MKLATYTAAIFLGYMAYGVGGSVLAILLLLALSDT
jgi:hypothetical protein